MRRLALFITLAAVATLIVFEAPSAEAYNGAPWFKPSTPYSSDFADPSVVRDGNTYYAFATTTGGAYLPEMTSTDLSTWIAHPAYQQPACVGGNDDPFFNDAFPCPPAWGEDRPVGGRLTKELWAPGPAHIGNNWMVFYAMRVSTNPDRFCIGRAASSTGPLGPYVDNSAGPFVCDSDPVGSIDPQPFIDDDGTPYLIWKSEGDPCINQCLPQRIWSQQLTADGSAFAPGTAPTDLMDANWPNGESTWENTVAETPAMGHFEGHYLLFYSGNIWHSTAYGIGYADCSGPLGPCTKLTPTAPVRGSDGTTENGPGAATPFLDASGQLQLAYDYWNPPYSDYPTDPGCDGTDPQTGGPYCVSQGQRRMKIRPVYLTGSAVQIGGTPPVRAVARATDDSCPAGKVPPAGFTDIPPGDVHAASIDCVVWWKVANGTGDGSTYSPSATVIRGQMASFIARMLDTTSCVLSAATHDFFPDDNTTVYEADINRLAQAGIVGGRPDGTYGPNNPVSRAQMATFLVHAYEHCGTTLTSTRDWFPDDNGNTHEPNINKAAEAGFAGGRADGTYAPANPVARDQMASFLARVLDLLVENGRAHTPT